MYALSGFSWPSPSLITYSYLPDRTATEWGESVLFAHLAHLGDKAVWQKEVARAFQSWAQAGAGLHFQFVAEGGAADIRVGCPPVQGETAFTYLPDPSLGERAGNIFLSSLVAFSIGAEHDLQTLLLHEIGHALGLLHSSTLSAVMYPDIAGIKRVLTADDVAGVRAIYGTA